MDGDQQLNFNYSDPVAIMDRFIIDRFICQPNFAGKTYIKFERQELKQRIRQQSKVPISGSPAHRHAQSLNCCIYSMLTTAHGPGRDPLRAALCHGTVHAGRRRRRQAIVWFARRRPPVRCGCVGPWAGWAGDGGPWRACGASRRRRRQP